MLHPSFVYHCYSPRKFSTHIPMIVNNIIRLKTLLLPKELFKNNLCKYIHPIDFLLKYYPIVLL